MNRIELSRAGGTRLVRADLELGSGVYTVVAQTPHGADELVELTSGALRPQHGTVRVDGEDPYTKPSVRRRIGSLLAIEPPFESRTVEAGVSRAMDVQESAIGPVAVLESFGLSAWAKRRPSSLSASEARAVALAVALASSNRTALALFEPLATPAGRARVVAAIAEAARQGASVLCVTASARDAGDLGGRAFPLRFGRIGGESSPSLLGAPDDDAALEFVVRTDEPRRLAAALCADSACSGVRCDLALRPGEIIVRGAEAEAVSVAVLRGARQSGANILGLWRRRSPGVRSAAGSGWGVAS